MVVVAASLVVGAAAIHARSRHVHGRRKKRRSKATLVLTQLAQRGCDLQHFQRICEKAKGGVVDQREVRALTADSTILESVNYIIGLYARSETTRDLVDRAGALGTSEYLREREKAKARKRLSLLAEAGFDVASLLLIAGEASENGWGEDDLLKALEIVCNGNSAKEALQGEAIVLIQSCMNDEGIASLCDGIVNNAEVVGELAGEVTGCFLEALFG